MTTFFKTLLETAKDRLKNPLIGTFVFLWVIFNWKPLIIIFFSNQNIENRILLINDEYSSTFYFIPFGFALLYVIGLPFLNWLIEIIINKSAEPRKNLVKDGRVNDLKRDRDIIEERTKLEKAIAENTSQNELNSKISELNIKILEKESQLKKVRENFKKMIPSSYPEKDLSKSEEDILNNLYLILKFRTPIIRAS